MKAAPINVALTLTSKSMGKETVNESAPVTILVAKPSHSFLTRPIWWLRSKVSTLKSAQHSQTQQGPDKNQQWSSK